MSGRELSRRFYSVKIAPAVGPVLGRQPHAAAMLGDGSDVLGYDDDISPDHDSVRKSSLSCLRSLIQTRC